MHVGNIVIVGTSHIANQSIKEVAAAFEKHEPAVVAIELDKHRLYALLHPQKRKTRLRDIRSVGFAGFVFSLIGAWAERMMMVYGS